MSGGYEHSAMLWPDLGVDDEFPEDIGIAGMVLISCH